MTSSSIVYITNNMLIEVWKLYPKIKVYREIVKVTLKSKFMIFLHDFAQIVVSSGG
jgi:hypothetical protein